MSVSAVTDSRWFDEARFQQSLATEERDKEELG
jgi:hypothetical protein